MTDLTAAPRPVPTTEDRMRDARTDHLDVANERLYPTSFATYLDRTERNQLDARAACAEQERDEALDARNVLRAQLDQAQQRNRDVADLLRRKQDTISALAAELGDAHDLIAEIRNNRANDDRAFARWETRQSGQEPGLGSAPPRAQEQPEREEIRWAYRWIGTDGQVYDEMDASDNAMETAEQRAHRIAAKRLTGTVRGEVVRYRVLTMPAEVVATYPAEEPA